MKIQSTFLVSVVLISSLSIILDGISAVHPLDQKELGRIGEWAPIKDVYDPYVIELGRFAVAEYNKVMNKGLEFVDVVEGLTEVFEGINYWLLLKAKFEGHSANYSAMVWEKDWLGLRNLTSFSKEDDSNWN